LIAGDPIFVIEPHADDAFLSLGGSIHEWAGEGRDVEVVTVFTSDQARARETERWAASVGARWRGLGHEQRDTARLTRAAKTVLDLPTPLLPAEMMSASACRIWPLGFQHPDHIAVATCAPERDLRYLETPYQLSLPSQPKVRQALEGRTIEWWLVPPRAKWEGSRFFESQTRLFEWFSPDVLQMVPEVVVR
jgi:hypothetical protein